MNPDFQFTTKLFQGFTHIPRGTKSPSPFRLTVSSKDEGLPREGLDSIASEGRLGAVLVQFPVSFKNADDTRDYLFSLVRKFSQYPLVLEIRHASWNDPEILGRLAEEGVGFCNIDQPRLGKSLRGTAHMTAPIGYVRLHGRNYKEWFQADNRNDRYNYLYKPKELKGLERKDRAHQQGDRENFCCRQQSLQRSGGRKCAGVKEHALGRTSESAQAAR